MKIVLVNPLWSLKSALPVNLAELAGYIRRDGNFDVAIVDLNYELRNYIASEGLIERAVAIVSAQKPDMVGLTCNTIHVPFCSEFCKAWKKASAVPVTLGGIHPTFRPDAMFSLSGADYIVRGEGEETLLALLHAFVRKDGLSKVPGLSYRAQNRIFHNPDRALIADLSKLPLPAFDLLLPYVKSMRLRDVRERGISIQLCATRGCPYGCVFCSAHRMWRYQRRKPVSRVIEEIRYVKKEFQCGQIEFGDDCLSLHRAWFGDLLAGVRELNIPWSCLSRIDALDHRLLARMKDAGCNLIYHGLESASPRIRRLLHKQLKPGITNRSIAELVAKEIKMGIQATCSFMVGIPTETKQEIIQTFEFARALQGLGAHIQLWIMTPYPDTSAARIYQDRLIKVDRWKLARQSDVNRHDQAYLYRGFYDRYYKENPDFYMFKPDMPLADFLDIYRHGRQKLDKQYYHDSRLYDYMHEKGGKKYFIGLDKTWRIGPSGGVKKPAPLITIESGDFFDSSDRLLRRLRKDRPGNCFISVAMAPGDYRRSRGKLAGFLQNLADSRIPFVITRPLPLPADRELPWADSAPAGCEDCLELFKVNREGFIELCSGKLLFKKQFADTRSSVFEFFIKLGRLMTAGEIAGCACPRFPRDKKSLRRLEQRFETGKQCMRMAKKYFLSQDTPRCISYLHKARALHCSHGMVPVLLGFCYERNQSYDKALAELKVAERIYPGNPQVRFALLRCYRNTGRIREAAAELAKLHGTLKHTP